MTQQSLNYAKVLYALHIPYDMLIKTLKVFQLDTGKNLMQVLTNPTIAKEKRYAIISAVFQAPDYSEVYQNFLKVLCAKGQMQLLPEITESYRVYDRQENGYLVASVHYAGEMNDERKIDISSYLSKRYHTDKLDISYIKDSSLVGGFVIRVEDLEIDWSIKGRMQKLQNQLLRR